MASATERKPFSAQLSAPPTLSAMLFGISSFWADVGKADRTRLAITMRAADFMVTSPGQEFRIGPVAPGPSTATARKRAVTRDSSRRDDFRQKLRHSGGTLR